VRWAFSRGIAEDLRRNDILVASARRPPRFCRWILPVSDDHATGVPLADVRRVPWGVWTVLRRPPFPAGSLLRSWGVPPGRRLVIYPVVVLVAPAPPGLAPAAAPPSAAAAALPELQRRLWGAAVDVLEFGVTIPNDPVVAGWLYNLN